MPIFEDRNISQLPAARLSEMTGGGFVGANADGNARKISGDDLTPADSLKVVSNPEYIYAIVDSENKFLFGIKKDGSVEWSVGCPKVISDRFADVVSSLSRKVDKVDGLSLINSVYASSVGYVENDEYVQVTLDSEDKVIEGIDKDGKHFFKKGVNWSKENLKDLENALKLNGFSGGQGDWSDKNSLVIPIPSFAILNIADIAALPTTKTANSKAVVQFWDMNGNYFKKYAVLNAQGNSTLAYDKKNFTIDLFNDEDNESDFYLKVGDLVEQKSFHLKANYIDYFRGVTCIGYSLMKDIIDTRSPLKNRTWKSALISGGDSGLCNPEDSYRIDDGALCFPFGFPISVYLNGSFYGIYTWQIKKHAANYHLNTKNPKNIHLDGTLSPDFWNGNIDWSSFEIRSPKNLYSMSGASYDGDNPSELASSSLVDVWISSGTLPDGTLITPKIESNLRNTAEVKTYIVNLSRRMGEISAKESSSKKEFINKYFDIENLIDYLVFGDTVLNFDGFWKNWQWTTWDGIKWFVNPYDLDSTFGQESGGTTIHYPLSKHFGLTANRPTNYAVQFYNDELQSRWKELRDLEVISVKRILDKFTNWTSLIGNDFFNIEYEKWANCPCDRDISVNAEYWSIVKENGYPKIVFESEVSNKYSSVAAYNVGDVVEFNKTSSFDGGSFGWYYQFTCVKQSTSNSPILKFGVKDSVFRVARWLEKNIENMDVVYNYNKEA